MGNQPKIRKSFTAASPLLVLIFLMTLFTVQVKHVSAASSDSWAMKTPIPTQRYGLAVAVVNSRIYAIGGILLHGPINTRTGVNEEYNPITDTWTNQTTMPTPRVNFGIAVYQNKIYCIGGSTSNAGVTGINEVYDPATDTWEAKSSMPTPRDRLSASIVNGKIYLIGGSTNVNEVYDPQTDTWTTKSSLPNAVSEYASAVVNDKIYVIGGYNGNGSSYLTQIYSPATDTWSNGSQLPSNPKGYYPGGAGATTGVYAPKRIYVFGGSEAGLMGMSLNTTLVYDPEKDAWSYGARMITGRSDMGVAVVDDVLYTIGGGIWWGSYTGANEQYTPIGYGTVNSPEPTATAPIATATPTATPSPTAKPQSLPAVPIAASTVIVVIVGAGLLVYFKKRKR
jgi:N-acetylneuraminic acid mutarotase